MAIPTDLNVIDLAKKYPTRYRHTDPKTSRNKYTKRMDYKILKAIKDNARGMTVDEIAIKSGFKETSVSSRVSDMAKNTTMHGYGILLDVLEVTRPSKDTKVERLVYQISHQGNKLLGDIFDDSNQ